MKKSQLLFLLPFCIFPLTGCSILKNFINNGKSETPDYEEVSYETFIQEARKAHSAGHSYTTAIINGYFKEDTYDLFFSSFKLYFDDGEWVTADGSVTKESETGGIILQREAYTFVDDGVTQYYFGKEGFKMTIDTEATKGTAKFNAEGLLTLYSATVNKNSYLLSFSYKTNPVNILRRVDYSTFHDLAVNAHEKGHSYTRAKVNGYIEGSSANERMNNIEFELVDGTWKSTREETILQNMYAYLMLSIEAYSIADSEQNNYYCGNGFKISINEDGTSGYVLFNTEGLLTKYKFDTFDASSGDYSRGDISVTYSH